jgi:hypothetical protein
VSRTRATATGGVSWRLQMMKPAPKRSDLPYLVTPTPHLRCGLQQAPERNTIPTDVSADDGDAVQQFTRWVLNARRLGGPTRTFLCWDGGMSHRPSRILRDRLRELLSLSLPRFTVSYILCAASPRKLAKAQRRGPEQRRFAASGPQPGCTSWANQVRASRCCSLGRWRSTCRRRFRDCSPGGRTRSRLR